MITTLDVIHDAVDPIAVLRSIFRALKPDGIYVCLDVNCSDKLEENTGPIGSMFHGISILYCLTTSLAGGGAGLGTLGLHEHKLRDLATVIGFRRHRNTQGLATIPTWVQRIVLPVIVSRVRNSSCVTSVPGRSISASSTRSVLHVWMDLPSAPIRSQGFVRE